MPAIPLSTLLGISPSALLARLMTVDGAGSGLDADLLDGQQGSFYLSASNLNAGTVPAARMPALTGDVTTTAGTTTTTIAPGAVTLPKMANVAANSFIGNNTGASATPVAMTVAQAKSLLSLSKSDVGLSNVDNTSDANKPVSTATQTALNAKADTGATVRFAGLYIGADTDVYIYEGSAGKLSFRVGSAGSYAYAEFTTGGDFKTLTGYIQAATYVAGDRVYAGWDGGVAGSMSCNNWFRSNGDTGWYSNTYGGGIYMTDTTYVRAYNGKQMAAADFVISSDARLKDNVQDFTFTQRLRPVTFRWKRDGRKDFGFLADDVKRIYPDAVGVIKGDKAAGEPEEILQLSYQKLTAVLAAQLNLTEDRVAQLELENANLMRRLKAVEDLVSALVSGNTQQ